MPNARLTKDDGNLISLPADSVVAILSTALDAPNPDRPAVRSIVMATVGGMTAAFLSTSAAEAAGEIEKARAAKRGALRRSPKPIDWLELACGDDVTRLQPGSVPAYEAVADDRLRLFWTPAPGADPRRLDVNDTPENRERLDADIEGKD